MMIDVWIVGAGGVGVQWSEQVQGAPQKVTSRTLHILDRSGNGSVVHCKAEDTTNPKLSSSTWLEVYCEYDTTACEYFRIS